MLKKHKNIFINFFYNIDETEPEPKKTINWNSVFIAFMVFYIVVGLLTAVI